MKKILLSAFFLSHFIISLAQLQGVNLSNLQACGSATLVPQPLWGAVSNATSLHYEKQSGSSWVEVLMQPYVNNGNWMIITASDITAATLYRIRAVDNVTGQEFISNGSTVNPATWNADRGTPSVINNTYWGGNCANQISYVTVDVGYTFAGRPPFTVEYKKTTDSNYTIAGTGVYGYKIDNLDKTANYNIRVTDFCGKLSITNAFKPVIGLESFVQDPGGCNNGAVHLSVRNDGRYSGYPPYTYSLGKKYPNMTDPRPPSNYVSSGDFTALTPGTYFSEVKDACGNYAAIPIINLGGGFPFIKTGGTVTVPNGDSCLRNLTLSPLQGMQPFTYGYRFRSDPSFAWQNSNTLENLSREGYYVIQCKDACGQIGDDVQLFVGIPAAQVNTVTPLSTSCVTDIVVRPRDGVGYKPFQYGTRQPGTTSYTFQNSDTIKGVGGGALEIAIKDRCGNTGASFIYNGSNNCSIQPVTGIYQSAGSVQGCQDYSGNGWIDVRDDNGYLIYSINPNNNLLPQVCWGMNIVNDNGNSLRSTNINGKTTYFLDRNFFIEPQAGTILSGPVSLRIYISNNELQNMLSYLNNNGMPATINDLRILKKKGTPGSPVGLDVVIDSMADPSQFTVIQPLIKPFGSDWYLEFSVNDFSEFNPSFSVQAALPLQLLSFTGTFQLQHVLLQWKTAGEVNTHFFSIEKSDDGSRFRSIGKINAHGNYAAVLSYQFEDMSLLSAGNYYRLKMVDLDGRFTYSNIILLRNSGLPSFNVSPNPATGFIIVGYNGAAQPVMIQITDAMGRRIRQQPVNGTSILQVNISGLKPGWYLLELQTTRGNMQQAFLKH